MQSKILTPAMYAREASGGKWYAAKHIMEMDRAIVNAFAGLGPKRIIVQLPPRHGKSEYFSKYLQAWFAGSFPDKTAILASYEADFAAGWGRKARDLLDETGHWFGVSVNSSSKAANRWGIQGHDGGMMTAGAGGPITGKGAHLLTVDDIVKNAEEASSKTIRDKHWDWWQSTAYTRIEPGGVAVVVMCLTGDTLVMLADGTQKPIRDIRPMDEVATYDQGRLTRSRVLNWADQGEDDVFTITTKSGATVKANARHPFLVDRNGDEVWVKTGQLKPGDRILRVTGVNGRVCCVPKTAAKSQSLAKVGVPNITGNTGQKQESDRRLIIPRHGVTSECVIGTASVKPNTKSYSKSKTACVQSASSRPVKTLGLTGVESSVSTIVTKQERSEGFCATTATSQLVTPKPKQCFCQPLSTYEITGDPVVSVVASGREVVYDIQVEATENFIANGLVSHNTRWHQDDLAGRLIADMEDGGEEWLVINFPAICEMETDSIGRSKGDALWPKRYSVEDLKRIERTLGPRWWAALYQQRPAPLEGGLFKRDWLPKKEVPTSFKRTVRAWDLAGTEGDGDWTAGVLLAYDRLGKFYVVDVVRGQWGPSRRDEIIHATAKKDGSATQVVIEQEPGSAGKAVVEYIKKKLKGYSVKAFKPTGPKEIRAEPFASQCGAGTVTVATADWNYDFIEELCMFPNGTHDDQVDAAAMAFQQLSGATGGLWSGA